MTSQPTSGSAETIAARQQELAGLLERLAPTEGTHASPLSHLEVLRANQPRPRTPVVYQPCLCVVAQGRKHVYLGSEDFIYDALRYLVISVPLPLEGEVVQAEADSPFLALRLHLDATKLSELVLEAEGQPEGRARKCARRGIQVSPLSEPLHDAVCRLVTALEDPNDRRILAPLAEREVLYRLLHGEQGELLRDIALRDGHTHRIAQALHFMQDHYAEPLDIATIAEAVSMSPSTLHHTFKSVTASSPLQYLKTMRLHHARLLMLHDGLRAGEAADRVGYASEFQFNREYKRLFGTPPMRDVTALRAG